MILVVNVGESQLDQVSEIEARLAAEHDEDTIRAAALCGKLEMELAQMDDGEAAEFRGELGLSGESGLSRMIRLSYDVLGLITFFTVGEDEDRAWPVERGTPAVKGAGKIHSDLERGFIRAEVVGYDDMITCKTLAEARKRGVLRQEGKTYEIKDGDIMNILFNV